jgi:hypothetical protein
MRTIVRALLTLPFIVLVVAAGGEALTTPFVWSAEPLMSAAGIPHVLPAWVVSLSPFIVATPSLASGLFGLREVLSMTSGSFSFTPIPLLMGLFTILAFIAMLVVLSGQPPESVFEHDSLGGTSGRNEDPDDTGVTISLAITSFASIFFGACLAGSAFIYCSGMNNEGSGRYDRRPDEPDAMAALIASSRAEKRSTSN